MRIQVYKAKGQSARRLVSIGKLGRGFVHIIIPAKCKIREITIKIKEKGE